MKRVRASALVEELVDRLIAESGEWPASLITNVYLFGSFARGATEPHDVDVMIEFERDRQWATHMVCCMSYGRNPWVVFTKPLGGGRRSYQFTFDKEDHSDIDLTLLWRRGESREIALSRMQLIHEDQSAGRAPRHAMLAQFEGLDRWLGRPDREQLVDAIERGAITVERLTLQDVQVLSPAVYEYLTHRWIATSPLRRAASAALAYLEQRGLDPSRVHLHGEDIIGSPTPYFVGLGLRHLRAVPWCLTEKGGVEWIDVVHPTRNKPLDALSIRPLDATVLAALSWD